MRLTRGYGAPECSNSSILVDYVGVEGCLVFDGTFRVFTLARTGLVPQFVSSSVEFCDHGFGLLVAVVGRVGSVRRSRLVGVLGVGR